MSLELSRRSFLKCSAAAAVLVACNGMLTGCSDSNKPTKTALGTDISVLQAKTTLSSLKCGDEAVAAGSTLNNTTPLVAEVKIVNGRDNPLEITPQNFWVEVYKNSTALKDGKPVENGSSKWQQITLSDGLEQANLKKKGEAKGTLTWAPTANIVLETGNIISFHYRPDRQYSEIYATWNITL
ncbi:MAG: twin-arginine translocation signal domain-containing protein [Faecalibacterium sp.]